MRILHERVLLLTAMDDLVLVAPQGFEPRYAAPEAAVLTVERGGNKIAWASLAARLAGPLQGAGRQNQLVHHKWICRPGQTLQDKSPVLHAAARNGLSCAAGAELFLH